MTLDAAWRVLGKDPNELVSSMRKLPDLDARLLAAEAACEDAKRLAKGVMGKNHPDVNPGDPGAAVRFREAQDALESIRWHTQELREAVEATKNAPPRPSKSLIVIKG
jgi:hypothetical protein